MQSVVDTWRSHGFRSICKECRTLLRYMEPCDVCGETNLSLANEEGMIAFRHRARPKVHDPRPAWQLRAVTAARWGAVLLSAGSVYLFFSLRLWVIESAELMCIAFTTGLIASYLGGLNAIRQSLARKRQVRIVAGAYRRDRPPAGLTGTVSAIAPQGPTRRVELFYDAAGLQRLVLASGETAGLTVALDDGRVVAVPAGRARITDRCARYETQPYVASSLWLWGLGGDYAKHEDTFLHNEARVTELGVGDSVELVAELERDQGELGGAYREHAGEAFVVRGVPWIVRVAVATPPDAEPT